MLSTRYFEIKLYSAYIVQCFTCWRDRSTMKNNELKFLGGKSHVFYYMPGLFPTFINSYSWVTWLPLTTNMWTAWKKEKTMSVRGHLRAKVVLASCPKEDPSTHTQWLNRKKLALWLLAQLRTLDCACRICSTIAQKNKCTANILLVTDTEIWSCYVWKGPKWGK